MRLVRFILAVKDRLVGRDLWVYATAAAFHLLICSVPFAIVLLALLGSVVSREEAFDAVAALALDAMPAAGGRIEEFLRQAAAAGSGAGLLGGVALLVTTAHLMGALRALLNRVLGVATRRHFLLVRVYDLLLAGLLAAFFFISAVGLWALSALGIGSVFYLAALGVEFTLVYGVVRLLPFERPSRRAAAVAAAVFLVLFEAARQAMGFYLQHAFENYNAVWGATAAIVLAGLWAYYSAMVLTLSVAVGLASEK